MLLTNQTSIPSQATVHTFLNRLVIFVAMSYVFTSPICEANEVEQKIENAGKLFFDCQNKNIQNIDNKQLNATVVALNLTNICLDEYEALNKIVAQYEFDTSNERRMFTVDRNADYSKIDASLPIVNMNR